MFIRTQENYNSTHRPLGLVRLMLHGKIGHYRRKQAYSFSSTGLLQVTAHAHSEMQQLVNDTMATLLKEIEFMEKKLTEMMVKKQETS